LRSGKRSAVKRGEREVSRQAGREEVGSSV